MRNDKRMKIAALLLTFIALVTTGWGQDLGTANTLFGAGEKKPAATSKAKTTKKPAAKSTKPVAKAKPKTAPANAKANSKTDAVAKKPVVKPTTPKTAPAETSVVGNKFKTFETAKPVTTAISIPPKTSATTESRYEDLIEQGNAARDDRDYAAAEKAYSTAKGLKPRDSRAIYGLGNLYSDQQRWEEAETAYRAALKIESTNAFAHIALSYVLTQPIAVADLGERYAEAERLGRRAIQLDPKNALAYDQLGVAMELRGLIGAETEAAYRKAIDLDSSFAPAYSHLGRLLRRRGLTAESAAAYKKAVSLATDVPTMILVAEVMQSEQRFADSEPLLRSAIGGDPKNPTALLLLGRALTAQGKYADAEQVLRRSSLDTFMPNSLLGSLYWRQGKLDQAESALMRAVKFVTPLERRQLASQFQQIGDGFKKAGRSENATRAYRQAKALENEGKLVASIR